ncbi:8830_t:CDS:2 [Entrophospora sp. SA101]|nr:8830_t:CDS:2 [Entrophospora sp. SA101]
MQNLVIGNLKILKVISGSIKYPCISIDQCCEYARAKCELIY